MEREQEKVVKKLRTVSGSATEKLQRVLDQIQALKDQLTAVPGSSEVAVEQSEAVRQCMRGVKETAQAASNEHKDMHATISKLGKAIDKNFSSDISAMSVDGAFSGQPCLELNRVMCEHLFRQGKMEVGEALMQEAELKLDPSYLEQFTELNHVLEALRSRNVEPALEWAVVHRDRLLAHGSCLEFKLRQLKFLSLLCCGQSTEALAYAKILGQFSPKHINEIKRLMGCFLFAHRGLEHSPYSDLLDPWHWTEVADMFAKDACKLLGLSLESPLRVSLSAGCLALPQLLHLRSVMVQRQVSDIWSRDELPCEVNLGWERRYHSVFTCPILRQQTTDANPPMRLSCGHAISRDAMKKLVSHSRSRLKCPYCPVEMLESEVKEIKF